MPFYFKNVGFLFTLITVFFISSCSQSNEESSSDPAASADPDKSVVIPITEVNPQDVAEEPAEGAEWRKLTLPDREDTKYEKSEEDGETVIKATSENTASGLMYIANVDPNEYPIVEWSWKIDGVIDGGDLTEKDGDDYAARIYITFDFDKKDLGLGDRVKYEAIETFTSFDIPLRAINYVWANKAEEGTIEPNPHTDWVYMVAAQTGDAKAGEWVSESRNILEDYREAFDEEPPAITGVAIMTDSDNTGGSAVGYYKNVVFKKATQKSGEEAEEEE